MAKYPDRKRLASDVIRYRPAEHWKERHARRKKTALDMANELKQFAHEHSMIFKVTNNGHHFQLRRKKGLQVDWWPSSAKLVINQQWKNGIHCHDVIQFKEQVKKRLA